MSTFEVKTPSEGELSEGLATNEASQFKEQLQINKSEVKRTKSLGSSSDIPVFSNSSRRLSGVRVVWRTTPTAELENLNRVLGIPKRARSPSPRAPAPPVDHVFSESFDPLAVQRRPSTDTADFPVAVTKSSTSNTHSNLERRGRVLKRQISIESSDMTSVKSLRSLFEELVQQRREINERNAVRRAKTLSGYELFGHEITKEHLKLSHNKNQNSQDLQPSVNILKKNAHLEDKTNTEEQKLQLKPVAIEVDPLPPVKRLKNVYERSLSIPNEINTGKVNQELSSSKRKSYRSNDEINRDVLSTTTDKPSTGGLGEKTNTSENKTSNTKRESEQLRLQNQGPKNKKEQLQVRSLIPETEKDLPRLEDTLLVTEIVPNVKSNSLSVSSLKAKWEALTQGNKSPVTVPITEKKNTLKTTKKLSNLQSSQNMKHEVSLETSETVSSQVQEKTSTQVIKSSNYPQSHPSLERTTSLRNSVRNISLIFETNSPEPNNMKNILSSSTSSIAASAKDSPDTKRDNKSSLNISADSSGSSPSPIKSTKINPAATSKSLENMKQRFISTSSKDDDSHGEERNLGQREAFETNRREISLGSLERKASVRDLKKKFEQGTTKKEFVEKVKKEIKSVNNVDTVLVKESKNCEENSMTNEEPNKMKVVKQNSEQIRHESDIFKLEKQNDEIRENPKSDDVDKTMKPKNLSEVPKEKLENKQNCSKIENLMKEFVEAEGINELLDISKEKSNSPVSNTPNLSLPKPVNDLSTFPNHASEMTTPKDDLVGNVSDSPPFLSRKMRSLSTTSISPPGKTRELNEDEMKFFENLQPKKFESNELSSRSRSSTVASSEPSSLNVSVDASPNGNVITSTPYKFRNLHTDELKYFESTGVSPKLSKRSFSELSLRHETLDKALRMNSPPTEVTGGTE